MLDLTADLNPAQKTAVEYLDGPLMIIAGAGSGKTRVITYRIAFLAREVGIPIYQILAVTFTNKAAKEMRARVCKILEMQDLPSLPIGTFHARCAMILRREWEAAELDKNFAILDENDQRQAVRATLKEMGISEKRARPAQVQSFINQAKMRLLTPADCKEEFDEDEIPYADIYAAYQAMLDKNKSVDFEDLMMRTVRLFQEHEDVRQAWAQRYQYILIDEYQDTNHAQFLLTKLLAQDHRQITIVGDEDQSIYSWRGAEISNLLDFEQSFPGTKIVKLERNYRSTNTILKAANRVIANNTQRIGKELFTEEGEGSPLQFISSRNQDEEAISVAGECLRLTQREGVDPNEIAIFYRGHWLSRGIEDALRQFKLPYRIVGGIRFYDRAEIKDLLSFMRLAVNPDDDLAFDRVVNRPARGIGGKTLSSIAEFALIHDISHFSAAMQLNDRGQIKGKARNGIDEFTDAVRNWAAVAEENSVFKVLERILFDTNYKEDGLGDHTSLEAESKLQNIEEFSAMVKDFSTSNEENSTATFLSTMALDAAQETDDSKPKINLLTIHNAKGLEFHHVFLIGLESGVFPTRRAEESQEEYAIEEERRLFYVAVTRARKELTLCYSAQRNRPDFFANNNPSIFLSELTPEVFDEESVKQLRKLLPYQWGSQNAGAGEREIVYDDAETFGAQRQHSQPRAFSRMVRGGGSPFASANGAKPKFSIGMRVRHKHMGEGVIVEMGGRKGHEDVVVGFDDGRCQQFKLKYAPLVQIDE